jgi:hypothetical protein
LFGRTRRVAVRGLLVLVGSAALFAAPARADEVDVTADLDCTLYGYYETQNDCESDLRAGVQYGHDIRHWQAALKFDVENALPSGAVVESATLNLRVVPDSGNGNLFASAITHDWDGLVTWLDYDGFNPWSTGGGAEFAAPDDDSPVTEDWTTWNVTPSVSAWVDNELDNLGLVVHNDLEDIEESSVANFYSSEAGEDYEPYLHVEYTVVP